MNQFESDISKLVNSTYVKQGLQNIRSRDACLRTLLNNRKLPVEGWSDTTIEYVINELAVMDSNNFTGNAGVGEREGRIYSGLVYRRHFGLSHGIGRSGDIAEVQPKAAGSSLIYKLCTLLTIHALEIAGSNVAKNCLILPMATGMSLTMCLLALKNLSTTSSNEGDKEAKVAKDIVLWPRIDQKSCFKCIMTAGLTPVIIENMYNSDGSFITDLEAMEAAMVEYQDRVLCVLSTTSCFAPRQPDRVDEIGKLCSKHNCGHIINNAYGVQCSTINKLINRTATIGRVDYIVQSTDKNFMVPVGGAIVTSPSPHLIAKLSASYPGRASAAPILDLFITLLSMGQQGYRSLLNERERLFEVLREQLSSFAEQMGERIMASPNNHISLCMSLSRMDAEEDGNDGKEGGDAKDATDAKAKKIDPSFLGSMLFQRYVSGCRVVPQGNKVKKVAGHDFTGWGSHAVAYPASYLTAAVAMGATEVDIQHFLERLQKCMEKALKGK